MVLYLTPFYNDTCFPSRSLHRDVRLLNQLAENDYDDTQCNVPSTVRPNYLYEADDSGVHFELEMPGVEKEDIVVQVTGHRLVVTGKRFRKSADETKIDVPMQDADKPANDKPAEPKPAEHAPAQERPTEDKSANEPEPAVVYEFQTKLTQRADTESVKAKHVGNGVLRVHISNKVRPETRTIHLQ